MNPEVTAAIISAFGSIIGAVIASLAALHVGRVFLNGEKLKKELDAAVKDIAFLLKVEEEHCEIHRKSDSQASNKLRVRDSVNASGYVWSAKFTPGRYRSNESSFSK